MYRLGLAHTFRTRHILANRHEHPAILNMSARGLLVGEGC